MKKVEDLFKAKASSPLDIAMLYDGRVGFTIPEYQRQYDWSEENIERLFCDTLNGFQRLSESNNANVFTFLGTLILVEEQTKEENFSGESVAIVDGQQRLTTLALFACALCEALRRHLPEFDSSTNGSNIKKWLKEEINDRLYALYRCAIGSQNVTPTQTFPFPRIVRHGDERAKSKANSEYRSPIGKFLDGFAAYFDSEAIEYVPPALGKGTDAEKLANNFQVIRKLVQNLNCTEWYEDTECEQFDIEWTRRRQFLDLFQRLPDFIKDEGERHKAIEEIIKTSTLHELVRTLLFSAYFCNYVVLTRVITEDESAAFDIFDALNTTGEPLTALETLKPRVIQFENKKSGYAGSKSELDFKTISENLDERFLETSRKQAETKELIVTFALYLEGRKLSKDLAAQRNFLRKSYDGAVRNDETSARKYVRALAEAAQFRRLYWERIGIEELGSSHSAEKIDEVQLLASLISDMKTSLSLPILLRYWHPYLKHHGGEDQFIQALKAVVAFLVIRRAATGGTVGIDSDFRAVMAPQEGRGASRKFGLNAGIEHKNPTLSPGELKEALKKLLEHKLKTLDKSRWVEAVAANPLYQQSKDLARFMILSAGHQAIPSTNEPGTWKKSGVKTSRHTNNFWSYRTWKDSCYATVEHIAPDTESKHGWASDLYKDNILKHSLGNLILLPAKENAAIGSESWAKKKIFYLALTETSVEEQSKRIEEAKAAGISFPNSTIELLQKGGRLSLLDPLRDVDEWNSEVVIRRGKNIAELCWDMVWPWLN